ncbi:MAG: putative glycoside hydrolase [Atopostipes sp.]|nr:putative glycoside hydrolase [Atopostipes sp.]
MTDTFVKIQDDISEIKKLTNLEKNSEEADSDKNNDSEKSDQTFLAINDDLLLARPNKYPEKFVYDSGVDIAYPEDGVKGIYTTSHSASGEKMDSLVELINTTDLNAMVIDIKDDTGNITIDLNSDNELINDMTNDMIDINELMTLLEENDIYPIARIVAFKDTLLARSKPEWSFTDSNGSVWENRRKESFVNPYLEEVWDYNIEVAVEAAKLGFKEIQFDYVRFPEGFENRANSLNYATGDYVDEDEDVINMEYRNRAVTEFVRKSKEELMPYGADLGVDIFGYAALVRETPGIGQSFPGIAEEVDVISSMIYPSHWGPGNLGISKPDLEPYNVVNNYIEMEEEIFEELGEKAPTTRPWLQDFTASYLGAGNYKSYGADEVTAQIEALADNDIHEYLLWNAGNHYSEGAKYKYN